MSLQDPYISHDKGKLQLYPDNLSIHDIVKKSESLIAELETLKRATEDIIATATMQLRSEVKKKEVVQPWPPEMSHEKAGDALIPKAVSRFLQYLLTGSNDDCVS